MPQRGLALALVQVRALVLLLQQAQRDETWSHREIAANCDGCDGLCCHLTNPTCRNPGWDHACGASSSWPLT